MTYSPAFQKAFDLGGIEPLPSNYVEQMVLLFLELTDEDEKEWWGDLMSGAMSALGVEEYWRQVNALPPHLQNVSG